MRGELALKYVGKKEYGNFLKCVIVKLPHKTNTGVSVYEYYNTNYEV